MLLGTFSAAEMYCLLFKQNAALLNLAFMESTTQHEQNEMEKTLESRKKKNRSDFEQLRFSR